jgi:hypothetical protein
MIKPTTARISAAYKQEQKDKRDEVIEICKHNALIADEINKNARIDNCRLLSLLPVACRQPSRSNSVHVVS